jgi:7-keto-8-aminopelargonate synthetase-like enzyme
MQNTVPIRANLKHTTLARALLLGENVTIVCANEMVARTIFQRAAELMQDTALMPADRLYTTQPIKIKQKKNVLKSRPSKRKKNKRSKTKKR